MIERLMEVMPPPTSPIYAGSVDDWGPFETELGVEIPIDYKNFIAKYGSGSIDCYLWLLNPFDPNENLNLLRKGKVLRDAFTELRSRIPELSELPVFPQTGGVLHWGRTDGATEIGWITSEASAYWTAGIVDMDRDQIVDFGCSATEFLFKLLSKQLVDLRFFPDDFPSMPPKFIQPAPGLLGS